MPNLSICPNRDDLRRFALGDLPEADAAALEQHLETCERCLETLHDQASRDTLVDALREAPAASAAPPSELVEAMVQRIGELRQSLPPVSLRESGAGGAGQSQRGDSTQAFATPAVDGNRDTPTSGAEPVSDSTLAAEDYDFLSAPEAPGELGRLGGYRVLQVLGSGGMGVVFLAEDPQLQRQVALKVVRPALAASKAARQRFVREARLAASIEHDHLVHIYQVGEDRSMPFLAMQLLKGETLEARLRREQRLPISDAIRIGREIAEGLTAAHAKNLIHRDIKPANVFLQQKSEPDALARGSMSLANASGSDRVKILDFGLARAVDDDAHITGSGVIAGTPSYMAPEQARAEPLDARTDLFSLGCVMYRMLVGRTPFRGTSTMAVLNSLANDQPAAPAEVHPEIPAALSNYVMRLLAKNSAERPGSAREVVETLEQLDRGDKLPACPPAVSAPPSSSQAGSLRLRLRRWLVAAGLLLALIGGGWYAAQIVIRMQSEHGVLVVEIMDKDLEAVVGHKELKLRTVKHLEQTMSVLPGDKVVIFRDVAGNEIAVDKLTLKKGDQVRLRAWMEPRAGAALVAGGPAVPASAFDLLKRDAIPPEELKLAGGGNTAQAPAELVKVIRLVPVTKKEPVTIRSACISPDGSAVVIGAGNSQMLFYDVATDSVRTLTAPGNSPHFFTPDGKKLLISKRAKTSTLFLWDIQAEKADASLVLDSPSVAGFNVTSDNHMVVTEGTQILLLDAATLKVAKRLKTPDEIIIGRGQSVDGKRLATAHAGKAGAGAKATPRIRIWDLEKAELQQEFSATHEALDVPVTRTHFMEQNKLLVFSSSQMNNVYRYDLEKKTMLPPLLTAGIVRGIWYHEPSSQLATVSQVGTVEIWDVRTGNKVRTISLRLTKSAAGAVVRFAPDGRHLLVSMGDDVAYVLRLAATAAADPDRRLAEWALSKGANLWINGNFDVDRPITSPKDLPAHPFRLTGVRFAITNGMSTFTDADMERLFQATALTEIAFVDTPITDAGLEVLSRHPAMGSLQLFVVHGGPKISDKGIMAVLARTPKLRALHINYCGATDTTLRFLKKNLNHLTDLQARRLDIGAEGMAALRDLPLEKLSVGLSHRIDNAAVGHIGAISTLKSLEMYDTAHGANILQLQGLRNLTHLHLSGAKNISAAAFQQLSDALPKCLIEGDHGFFGSGYDADRRAAEAVLGIGAWVKIAVGDKFYDAHKLGELPKEPFFLHFAGHDLDLSGWNKVLGQFKDLKYLDQLYLEGKSIDDASLEFIGQIRSLRILSLKGSSVSDKGLRHLRALSLLNNLGLPETQITDAGLEHLAGLPISILELARTRISDLGVSKMAPSIVRGTGRLDLSSTAITDKTLSHFTAKHIGSLMLNHTEVTDAGLAMLNGATISELEFQGTKVTDHGLEYLAKVKLLRSVKLKGTMVTAAGIKKLAAALPNCTIESDHGTFGPASSAPLTAEQRKALEWVAAKGGVVYVVKDGQEVGVGIEKGMSKWLPPEPFRVTDIDLRPPVKDADLFNLAGLPSGITGHRHSSIDISDDGFDTLTKQPWFGGVKYLNLYGSRVTNEGIARLTRAAALETVYLYNLPEVSDEGLARLRSLPITRIDIANCAKVTGAFLKPQGQWQGLTRIGWEGNSLRETELAHLRHYPRLTLVRFLHVPLTDTGVNHLKNLVQLEHLQIEDAPITDAGLEHLTGLKNLAALYVQKTKVTKAGVTKLAAALPNCRITWDGGVVKGMVAADPDRRAAEAALGIGAGVKVAIGDKFIIAHKLEELPKEPFQLVFAGHDRDLPGWNKVLGQLKDLKQFDQLYLEGKGIDDATLELIGQIRSLRILNLNASSVSDKGLGHLRALSLLNNLGLPETQITDAGLEHLAGLPISVLDLAGTRISDVGVSKMAPTIVRGLGRLNLSSTAITDKALRHFAVKHIVSLVLNRTQVTDAGLALLNGATISELELQGTKVTDQGLEHLAKVKQLRDVKLKGTMVTAAGVKKFAAALPNCKIESDHGTFGPAADSDRLAAEWVLSIGGAITIKRAGDESEIKAISKLPSGVFELTVVDLVNNPKMSDAGLTLIKDCKNLTHLNLYNTRVSDVGLTQLNACKNLTYLGLYNTRLSDVGLASFRECKNLTHLDLGVTQVSDAGLVHFKDCKYLAELSLAQTQVSDAGLGHFKNFKNVIHLNLSNTIVSDAGLANFKDCKNLTYLAMNGTKLSDEGLAQVAAFSKLDSVNVRKTNVTAAGVKKLAAALPKCKIESDHGTFGPAADPDRRSAVWVLQAGGQLIVSTAPTEQVSVAEVAKLPQKPFHLYEVNLGTVDDTGLDNLRECSTIESLLTLQGDKITNVGLAKLATFAWAGRLPRLGLVNTRIDYAGMEHLKAFANVRILDLNGTRLSGKGLARIHDLPRLEALELCRSEITNDDLVALKGLKIASLMLHEQPRLTDQGLEHLAVLDRLHHLGLKGCNITDAGVAKLGAARNLTGLILAGTKVTGNCLKTLAKLENLTGIDLDDTAIGDADLDQLAHLKKLNDLSLENTRITDVGLQKLASYPQMTTVAISRCKVSAAAVKQLAAALPQCLIVSDHGTFSPKNK